MATNPVNNQNLFTSLPPDIRVEVLKKLELQDLRKIFLLKELNADVKDERVWSFNAEYIGCPLEEGESIFKQVTRFYLDLVRRTIIEYSIWPPRSFKLSAIAYYKILTKELINICRIFADAICIPEPDSSNQLREDCIFPWAEKHKEILAIAPLDDNGNPSQCDVFSIEIPGCFDLISAHIKLLDYIKRPIELKLRNGWFRSLTPDIGQLASSLKKLDIRNTPISKLPSQIGKLTSLTALNISKTDISSFPEELCPLTQLEKLDIRETKVSSIPDWIKDFPNLKIKSTA